MALKGGHSAARGLARDQSTSTIPENPARKRVIILDFDHIAVFDTAPPSVLELPVDWTGLDWTGLDWTGLDWTGLDWTGLDWTALT
jgi:hypothetical protein